MYEKTDESTAHQANISRFVSTLSTFCMFHFVSQGVCVCVLDCVGMRVSDCVCLRACVFVCVCERVTHLHMRRMNH